MAECMTTGKSKISRSVLEIYNKQFNCNITTLKDKQEDALNFLVHEKTDVISMLPTGYGKSLIYELLPIACKEELSVDAFVIVIEPLNVIIEQQKKKLGDTLCICLQENLTETDLNKIQSGCYKYIFSHPEHIIKKKNVYHALRQCKSKGYIVVDEAHCILDWGDEFRPIFREIKELRAVLPSAQVLALSATLSETSQHTIATLLLMRNFKTVLSVPTKDNITLTVLPRPPVGKNLSVKNSYDFVFESVFYDLKQKGQEYPPTIIYCCGNMDWVGYGAESAERILKNDLYGGNGTKCTENLRVIMFHSSIEKGEKLKEIIFKNLAMDPKDSPLKVVIATVALGMGADLRHIAQIIHAGPPKNIEAYIQHIGRGGRNGTQCNAILYYNSSDLGRPNISKEMKEYCRNSTQCRRKIINSYFGFHDGCPLTNCCNVCQTTLTDTPVHVSERTEEKSILRKAINSYMQLPDVLEKVNPEHLEQIVSNPKLYISEDQLIKDFNMSVSLAKSIIRMIEQVQETCTSK